MTSKLSITYWSLSQENLQAIEYYKFLDENSVEKISNFYQSGKFSQYTPVSQEDSRNAPIIFGANTQLLRIMRFKPIFKVYKTLLGKQDFSLKHIYFESPEKLDQGMELIFEIPLSQNVYICAKVSKKVKKTTQYLYQAEIIKEKSYGYILYSTSMRKAAPTLPL